MLKEWACEFFTLVAYHIFGQGFANTLHSFTFKCIKKHNFLVIDIFLILHNLLVNKFLFNETRLNGYHAAGNMGKVSLKYSNTFIPCMPRNLFHVGNV